MAVFSTVFERVGEGFGEVEGLAHACSRPLVNNQAGYVHNVASDCLLRPVKREDQKLGKSNVISVPNTLRINRCTR
jgi:hypothetical protein